MKRVKTSSVGCSESLLKRLLIKTFQEVKDLFRSNIRCDDEIVRIVGNNDLPEQHFLINKMKITSFSQGKFVYLFNDRLFHLLTTYLFTIVQHRATAVVAKYVILR